MNDIPNSSGIELVASADALTASITTMNENVSTLSKKIKRGRTQMVVLAISVLLDVLLSIGLYVAVHNTNDAQDKTRTLVEKIDKTNNAQKTSCEAGNLSATRQHELWKGLLALPSSTPTKPETLAAFNKLLDETYPQIDCSTIGK